MDLSNNSLVYEIQLMIAQLSRDSGLTCLGENLCKFVGAVSHRFACGKMLKLYQAVT